MPDHIHAFVGLKPVMALSDLVRDIKNNASNFINDHKLVKGKFAWQEGYGGFSYSHSQIKKVYDYILNQEKNHKTKTFKQEYLDFLKSFEVEYDEKYLFVRGTPMENGMINYGFYLCHSASGGFNLTSLFLTIIITPLRGFKKNNWTGYME